MSNREPDIFDDLESLKADVSYLERLPLAKTGIKEKRERVPPFGIPTLEAARLLGGQASVLVHLSYQQERYRRPGVASREHCGGADHKTINEAVRKLVKAGLAKAERPNERSAWRVTLKFGPWYRSKVP